MPCKIVDCLLPEWKDLPLHPLLKKGLHKLGFTKPTEIQKQAIPMAINGTSTSSDDVDAGSDVEMESAPKRSRDVVGVAETVSTALLLDIVNVAHENPSPSGFR